MIGEKVGLSIIQFVKTTTGRWRNAAKQWPTTPSGGEVSSSGGQRRLEMEEFRQAVTL